MAKCVTVNNINLSGSSTHYVVELSTTSWAGVVNGLYFKYVFPHILPLEMAYPQFTT